MARQVIDPDAMYHDLETLSHVYHTNEVRLLGGEPLLHPAIVETIEAARRSGVADSVVVWTNGTLLPRMEEDFWRAVDAVQVAVYPGHELSSEVVTSIEASAKRHGVLLKFNPYPTFRESHARLGTQDTDLVARIYSACRIAHDWRCHVVADGYFHKCPHSYFLPRNLPALAGADPYADGVKISSEPLFQQQLLDHLNSPEPLQSCSFCLGTSGRHFEHQQVSPVGWSQLQEHTTEELVDLDALAVAERQFAHSRRSRRRLPAWLRNRLAHARS